MHENGVNRRQLLGGTAALAALAAVPRAKAGVHTGSDALVVDGLDTSSPLEGFIDLLQTGGVDVVHKSIGGLESLGQILQLIDRNPDRVALARSVADIHAANAAGIIAIIVGFQSANHLERLYHKRPFESYDTMKSAFRAYVELGVRAHGITYNVTNVFGGGEDISELPNLVKHLRERGWNNAELDKMLGENWMRVYAEVWGA